MDTIADMLTRIRNAIMRGHQTVSMPYSKFKKEIILVLVKYGYLKKVQIIKNAEGRKELKVSLKYDENGESVVSGIKKISKGGQRIYSGAQGIHKAGGRRGMIVLSTSQGVMSHFEAKKNKVGGEVICVVY